MKNSEIGLHFQGDEIFARRGFALSCSRFCLDWPVVPHDHDFLEVAFVAGGQGVHRGAQEEKVARKGDGWLLFPGAWHAYLAPQKLDVCNLCFGESLLKRELCALAHHSACAALFWNQNAEITRRWPLPFRVPENDFAEFFALWQRIGAAPSAPAKIAATLLFLEAVAGYFMTENVPKSPAHRAVLRASQLMENDLARAWTLRELSETVHLAPNYFLRVFKNETGVAPLAFLSRLRAETAARLLLQTDWPIAQIGAHVGWDDPNYFARRFRAIYGQSASQFRAKRGA